VPEATTKAGMHGGDVLEAVAAAAGQRDPWLWQDLAGKPPDPAANPYLAFAALLMAGLDGIQNKIDPGEPLDKNIYELPPEELKKVPNVAGSLGEALDCLEKDHEFLLKGDVFTSDFLDMWISHKRKEHDALRLRPHPYEFHLYYDV